MTSTTPHGRVDLRTGSLFDADAPAIGHGCNTRGVMGAGVAKIVRKLYGEKMFATYSKACRGGHFTAGDAQLWPDPHRGVLVNLATQVEPGPHANLDLISRSLRAAAVELRERGIDRLAIPRIGCGIGGLEWDEVHPVLDSVAWDTGLNIEVWTPAD